MTMIPDIACVQYYRIYNISVVSAQFPVFLREPCIWQPYLFGCLVASWLFVFMVG